MTLFKRMLAILLFAATSSVFNGYYVKADSAIQKYRSGDMLDSVPSMDSDQGIARFLKKQGSTALRNENWNEATAHFGSAIQFDQNDVWLYWQRCWALVELGQYVAARSDCESAVELLDQPNIAHSQLSSQTEDYEAVYTALAHLLRAQGLSSVFISELNQVFSNEKLQSGLRANLKSSSRLKLQLAHALSDVGRYSEALEIFSQAELDTSLTDSEIDALILGRSNTFSQIGRGKDAILGYYSLVERQPNIARYHYLLCSQLIVEGDTKSAGDACTQATTLDPDNGLYKMALGVALFRSRKVSDALDVLQQARTLRPNSSYIRSHILAANVILGNRPLEDVETALTKHDLNALHRIINRYTQEW